MGQNNNNEVAANPLVLRVGDRGGVTWQVVGTLHRTAHGFTVAFAADCAEQAQLLWDGCRQKQEQPAAGLPEVFFGEQLPSGKVVLVARGNLSRRALARLRANPASRGEGAGGPRAPRSAWPS